MSDWIKNLAKALYNQDDQEPPDFPSYYEHIIRKYVPLDLLEKEKLRERLREQTIQTHKTYQQIHDAIWKVLESHSAIPEGLDQGHPIEQIVGTCLSAVQGKIDDLESVVTERDVAQRRLADTEHAFIALQNDLKELIAVYADVAQIFDGWHCDIAWSDWDTEVRKRMIAAINNCRGLTGEEK
jgi:hypothetical protein